MRNFIVMWLAYLRASWKFLAVFFVCILAYQHLNAGPEGVQASESHIVEYRQ